MKNLVIYHSADYDGIFCREIARKFLPDVELIGWDHGDRPVVPKGHPKTVYVMDLPCDKVLGVGTLLLGDVTNLIWIDHHKSAIDTHPAHIPGYRIDGVSACRLAWQWFTHDHTDFTVQCNGLPNLEEFTHRKVSEPLGVRLAGEYDIWDHRGDGDLELQFGLDSTRQPDWELLLTLPDTKVNDINSAGYVSRLIENGRISMQCYAKRDADIVLGRSFVMEFEGLKFLCLNTARCSSNTFSARDHTATGHEALMGFYFNGKVWTISLYHASHRKDIDLSAIAVKHGGGGHRGACGFSVKYLPFGEGNIKNA